MRWAILLAVLTLAACGADGPPQPPQSGVTVGGEARVGVTGKL
jgi:predicted small lipoprotein YifL